MDQAIRNKLRNVVTQCRKLLEESIAQQLQGKYDIYATGKKDEVQARGRSAAGTPRPKRSGRLARTSSPTSSTSRPWATSPRTALDQLIREIAFTHLNRLCAYKMMEVREV